MSIYRLAMILIIALISSAASVQMYAQDEEGIDLSAELEDDVDSGDLLNDSLADQLEDMNDDNNLGDEGVTVDDEDPADPDDQIAPEDETETNEELLPPTRPFIERSEIDETDDEAIDPMVADESNVTTETIQERYEDGKVKIRRQVTQDKDENYINHGSWVWFDKNGERIADCSFQFGKRHGKAMRWYEADEAKLFKSAPFNQYTGPYQSTANFQSGLLNGEWTISDNSGRKISEWSFSNGRRHGKSVWWYNNGQVMREINYQDGELHGELIEYSADGDIDTRVEYINGRRLEKFTKKNKEGKVTIQGMVLRARLSLKDRDEWWDVELAKYKKEGKDEKHGRWIAWHPNGQKKLAGEYQYDLPSGEFFWWHPNGQKSIQAYYSAGKKEGFWIWWHTNGVKSIQGSYVADSPVGRWTWWKETGKVDKRVDFSTRSPQVTQPNSQSILRTGSTAR